MKVLFVSRGNFNYNNGISPITKHQGDSLKKHNISIDYFTIKGKGVTGYIKSFFLLKNVLI